MIDIAKEILKFEDSDNNCYVNEENKITYKELIRKAREYASYLKDGNTPVIIYGHKSVDMLVSIISCVLAKRCYVPVDTFMPLKRLSQIIEETKASIIINNSENKIDNSIKLDELSINSDIDKLYKDICYIIFTSGSSGKQKGALLKRKNLNNFTDYMIKFNSKYKGSNVLNTASFSFDLSVADIYFTLCTGGTLYSYNDSNDLDYAFKFIKKNNIEYIVATPTYMKMLILDKDFCEKNFPSLKCIYFCGEVLSCNLTDKIFDRFPKIEIINAYGPTEACCAVSMINVNKKYNDPLPVGIMNNLATKVEIVDDEIILSGDSIFHGYINKECTDGVYKTGDIGYIKDGLLYCIGRKDLQIKYKGYRIELSDIENNLKKCDGVVDSVVIVKKSEDTVKYIKAFVVTNKKDFDEEQIKKELKDYLPQYMIPKIIKKIDEIPVTDNNKIDRRALEDD
ncbi:MAG: AMP-binding protein [Bacilli bacterium]|nr:AMP-binding protein [Bacilli bacterium]